MDDVVSKALGKRIPDLQTQIQSLQVTLQAFQTEKGELSKEIQSLKEIIAGKDERICVLEGRVHDLECTNYKQKSSLDSHNKTLESHGNKIAALERNEDQMQQYSRRNCIRVFGIPEEQVENTDDKICRLVREKLGVSIKKEDIDRSHRVGKKSTSTQRGIIVKLVSYRTRQEIISCRKKLKDTGLSIHEELTKKNKTLLQDARNTQKHEMHGQRMGAS